MKKITAVIAVMLMLFSCLPMAGAVSAIDMPTKDFDPVGSSLANTVSPYLEEGGFDSEDYFLTLEDFAAHKITFVNIWSDGCGPCMAEMPYFQRVHEEYGDRGVLVVGGVTTWIDGNFATEYTYLQNHGYTYMNVIPDDVLRSLYQKNGYVPQTFIVNSEGMVIDFIGGGTTYANLVAKIDYWTGIMDSGAEYTVTFMDGATNEVIETQTVVAGHSPIYPEVPEHTGYTFDGWFPNKIGAVTEDITITARYTATAYRVRFYDSITGDLIARVFVNYGQPAIAPEAPEHEGYVFVGWDQDFSFITHALDVYAIYQPTGGIMGDVDGNGSVNANDALAIMRHALGIMPLSDAGLAFADVDGNGSVNANDALYVLRLSLGLID